MSDFEVTVELQHLGERCHQRFHTLRPWGKKRSTHFAKAQFPLTLFHNVSSYISMFSIVFSFLQSSLRHVFGSLCGSPLREPALFADSTGQQVAFAVGRQLAIRHVA